jgi:hypothetical protein
MNRIPKDIARSFAIKNLDFLIVTGKNFQARYPQFISSSDKMEGIKDSLKSVEVLETSQIEEIPKFNLIFADKNFNEKHFVGKNFSNKLTQLHLLLQRLIEIKPEEVVNVLIASVDVRVPLSGQDRNQFVVKQAEKFISMAKDVNKTSELILEAVIEKQTAGHTIDVLTIASILLLLVGQRQSNVYYTSESLKAAQKTIDTTYDIDEICSIAGKVIQNTKPVPDIIAIRNCISHFAFDIKNEKGVLYADFHSNLSGYSISRRYSGIQLLAYYQNYERLFDILKLYIRSAFLQTILMEHFRG